MTRRTWHDNANEARALFKTRKDARLAILIATSVTREGMAGKATISQFAELASVSTSTVSRYLTMWDHFASNHPEYTRKMLSPDDAMTLTLSEDAQVTFDQTYVRTKVQDVRANPGAVAEALSDPAFSATVAGRITDATATNLVRHTVKEHPNAAPGSHSVVEDYTPRPVRTDVNLPNVNPTTARLRDVNHALDIIEGSIVHLPGRAAYDEAIGELHSVRTRIDSLIARGEIAREAFSMAASRYADGGTH